MRSLRYCALPACLLALGLACAQTPSETPDQPSAEITLDDLSNATYRDLPVIDGPVTLTDGEWEGEPPVPDSAIRPHVFLASEEPVTGDLNGDGTPEAVALIASSGGGTGLFFSLAVMEPELEGLQNTATAYLGDRVEVESLTIEDGKIVVQMVHAGPDDPACCPTERVRQVWQYAGDKLEMISSEVVGTR